MVKRFRNFNDCFRFISCYNFYKKTTLSDLTSDLEIPALTSSTLSLKGHDAISEPYELPFPKFPLVTYKSCSNHDLGFWV